MSAPIKKELHELGNGLFAYTQLPGTWGWSNAGLITDGGECLLVDTLFDHRITAEMLDTMRRAVPAAKNIGTVLNTHGNGDHCFGNALLAGAEIIGTRGCITDLEETRPGELRLLLRAGGVVQKLGAPARVLGAGLAKVGLPKLAHLADAAPLAVPLFEDFQFGDVRVTYPNRILEGSLTLHVGDKEVHLWELGPAHTRGDAVAWVPGDKTLFTGDLLFKDAHPLLWRGPVANWVSALERLLALDVETVVPGHGPLTDKTGLEETLRYLEALASECRALHDAGVSADDAAARIHIAGTEHWIDAERIYVNVHTIYRELDGETDVPEPLESFAGMGRLTARQKK